MTTPDTTEQQARSAFDAVLPRIVLPGEFDMMDETDKSRWLGALQQAFDAGRAQVEQCKERFQRILDEPKNTMSDGKAIREIMRQAKLGLEVCAAIDKARKA